MASVEDHGLRVEQWDPASDPADPERLDLECRRAGRAGANVLRLDPAGLSWEELRERGFVIRPRWIRWLASARAGSSGVLAGQSSKQRRRTRAALQELDRLDLTIADPVPPDLFDEWATHYSSQVSGMRHGLDLANAQRRGILGPGTGHALALWRSGTELVCGCIVKTDREQSCFSARFSTVAESWRGAELSRAMYARLADLAAGRELDWFSLGQDINFYGAVVKPGLCLFKLRLGFRPVPRHLLGSTDRAPIAERVLSLDGLVPPVLRFEYRHSAVPDVPIEQFLTGSEALGLTTVSPTGQTEPAAIPAHRALPLLDNLP